MRCAADSALPRLGRLQPGGPRGRHGRSRARLGARPRGGAAAGGARCHARCRARRRIWSIRSIWSRAFELHAGASCRAGELRAVAQRPAAGRDVQFCVDARAPRCSARGDLWRVAAPRPAMGRRQSLRFPRPTPQRAGACPGVLGSQRPAGPEGPGRGAPPPGRRGGGRAAHPRPRHPTACSQRAPGEGRSGGGKGQRRRGPGSREGERRESQDRPGERPGTAGASQAQNADPVAPARCRTSRRPRCR